MAAFKFRKRQTRRRWYAVATLAVAAFFTVFFVSGAFAAGFSSPSGFESGDGNTILDNAGNLDWNCFQGANGFFSSTIGGGGSSLTAADCHSANGSQLNHAADGTSAGEVTWKSGQKFDTACPNFNAKSTPPKDDFTYNSEYQELSGGDTYFYGGAVRATNNGNASGDVEFNQATQGSSSSCSGIPRTPGDIMIAYDFQNGGTNLVFHELTWIGAGSSQSCYVKTTSAPCWSGGEQLDTSLYNGQSNQSTIATADNSVSGNDLGINQFSEFGIDLTKAIAAVGGSTGCLSYPSNTWESRSSGSSFTSNPEDLEVISGEPINTCGSLTIIKHTLDTSGTRSGVNQDFAYTTTGGLTPSTFTLNDATGANVTCPVTTGTCNTQSYTDVPPGTVSVTETPLPTNYTLKSLTCYGGTYGGDATHQTTVTGDTVSVTLAAGDSVVCTYTNQKQKTASSMDTAPWYYPNDSATVSTSSQSDINGTVTFKLYDNSTDCAANGATGLLYGPDAKTLSTTVGTSKTVSTTNTSYKVSSTAQVYWNVSYGGDTTSYGRNSVCVENINATLTPDTGGTTP